MLSMLIVLSIASRVSILSRVEFEHLRIAIMLSRWSVESLVGLAKILKQIAGEIKNLTLAGLEPAIFGSEDQRLIH